MGQPNMRPRSAPGTATRSSKRRTASGELFFQPMSILPASAQQSKNRNVSQEQATIVSPMTPQKRALHSPLSNFVCESRRSKVTRRRGQGALMEPIDFHQFAEDCRRLADQVPLVEDKSVLLQMAQAWIRLADRAEEIQAML